jgi:hypothetical protein
MLDGIEGNRPSNATGQTFESGTPGKITSGSPTITLGSNTLGVPFSR